MFPLVVNFTKTQHKIILFVTINRNKSDTNDTRLPFIFTNQAIYDIPSTLK